MVIPLRKSKKCHPTIIAECIKTGSAPLELGNKQNLLMYKLPTILLFLFIGATAFSQDHKAPIYTVSGKAIKGYDPVAYFTLGKPVKGSENYSYIWKGSRWYFSSKKHLDLFKADAEKYAPEYGGYCAWAMKDGDKVKTDPYHAWTIYNGKLYLNYSKNIAEKWSKNKDGYIKQADGFWKKKLANR